MSFSVRAVRGLTTIGRFWVGPTFEYPVANCPVSRVMQASRSGVEKINRVAPAVNAVVGTTVAAATIYEAWKDKQAGADDLEVALKLGGGLLGVIAGPASAFGAFSKHGGRAAAGTITAFIMASMNVEVEIAKTSRLLIKETSKPIDPKLPATIWSAKEDLAYAGFGLIAASPFASKPSAALLNVGSALAGLRQGYKSDVICANTNTVIAFLGNAMKFSSDPWDFTVDQYNGFFDY